MAKYDEQVNKMLSLMEDSCAPKKVNSSIVYHANGADGKVYGILREGTKFYIKTTESGKENIAESYEYIGGFTNRRENEYKSINEATKHLEIDHLMALNEKYGKHEDVSTVDFKRSEKMFANLTEAARVELDRVNQIFENSCTIGMNCICDPESKGKSTGENTTKNNDPFTEKTNATLDKDPKFNGTVEGATENKEVNSVEKDLTSDKNKTANSGSEKDYKDAHDDLDGESVADKKPAGGKVVKVNEDINYPDANPNIYDDNGFASMNDPAYDPADANRAIDPALMAPEAEDETGDLSDADFEDFGEDEPTEVGGDTVGQADDDFDAMINEFESRFCNEEEAKEDVEGNKTASVITGPEKTLDGPHGEDGADAKWERVNEEDGNVNEPTKQGDEETMKSYQEKGTLPAQSWDKMKVNEAVTAIVEDVYKKLTQPKKKETLQEAINRIVKEEITKLDAWGKHPRFRKEPMTTPANKEVLAGTAEKDWNDDSAKGEQPYGQKIGKGDPFDKVVDMLTDQVMANLKESLKK